MGLSGGAFGTHACHDFAVPSLKVVIREPQSRAVKGVILFVAGVSGELSIGRVHIRLQDCKVVFYSVEPRGGWQMVPGSYTRLSFVFCLF